MLIPFEDIETTTLIALVESFILREGTDYGDSEVDLGVKTDEVLKQIHQGKILIVFSELHETCDLIPASKLLNN